jgi:hypothetical protein
MSTMMSTEHLPQLGQEERKGSSSDYNEKHISQHVVLVGEGQTGGVVKVEAVKRVWYVLISALEIFHALSSSSSRVLAVGDQNHELYSG